MLTKVFGPGGMRYAPEGDAGAGAGAGGGTVDGGQAAGGVAAGEGGPGAPGAGGAAGGVSGSLLDWRRAIPAEYQGDKVWEPYKDKGLDVVLKTYADQSKLLGRAITLPGKDAKPEDREKWKQSQIPKLVEAGLIQAPPVAPDKYELKQPDTPGLPPLNEGLLSTAKEAFHKMGFTQEQAQGALDLHGQILHQAVKWADDQNLAAVNQLEDKWGSLKFNQKWDQAVTGVPHLAAAMEMDTRQVKEYFDKTRKGNDPMILQMLAVFGAQFKEDQSMGLNTLGITGPEGANAEIERLRASEAYKNERHPGHEAAQKKLHDLYKLRDGNARAGVEGLR